MPDCVFLSPLFHNMKCHSGGDKPPQEEKEMNIVLLLFYVAVGIFLLKEIQYGKIQPTKKGVIVYSVGLVALLMLLMGRPEGVLPLFFLV